MSWDAGPGALERAIVTGQLGRPPRGSWRVVDRCDWGQPRVISVAPVLADGSPFPTTFWLTCPWLVSVVGDVESRGGASDWTGRLAADPALAARASVADAAYRKTRAAEAGGSDPCPDVGVAGQGRSLAVKCLHARVAAVLAGVGDPVGEGVLRDLREWGVPVDCPDSRCRSHGRDADAG